MLLLIGKAIFEEPVYIPEFKEASLTTEQEKDISGVRNLAQW